MVLVVLFTVQTVAGCHDWGPCRWPWRRRGSKRARCPDLRRRCPWPSRVGTRECRGSREARRSVIPHRASLLADRRGSAGRGQGSGLTSLAVSTLFLALILFQAFFLNCLFLVRERGTRASARKARHPRLKRPAPELLGVPIGAPQRAGRGRKPAAQAPAQSRLQATQRQAHSEPNGLQRAANGLQPSGLRPVSAGTSRLLATTLPTSSSRRPSHHGRARGDIGIVGAVVSLPRRASLAILPHRLPRAFAGAHSQFPLWGGYHVSASTTGTKPPMLVLKTNRRQGSACRYHCKNRMHSHASASEATAPKLRGHPPSHVQSLGI